MIIVRLFLFVITAFFSLVLLLAVMLWVKLRFHFSPSPSHSMSEKHSSKSGGVIEGKYTVLSETNEAN